MIQGVERPLILVAAGFCLYACSSPGPPVKTASGEVIEGVSYEERFPSSTEVHEVSFTGERLRTAVALMDRAEVIGMSGNFQAMEGGDKNTLLVTIRGAENRQRKIFMKNCAEEHVCAFFAAAVKSNLVEKAPDACRDGVRCTELQIDHPIDHRDRP
jgi:hypothetical protein